MTSFKRGGFNNSSTTSHTNDHQHHHHHIKNGDESREFHSVSEPETPTTKNLDEYVYQPPPYEPRAHETPHEPESQAIRDEKFQTIVNKYEIRQEYADILQQLQGFKITFIFDDSGSMNSVLNESPLNDNKIGFLKATRWNELQYFAKISLEVLFENYSIHFC